MSYNVQPLRTNEEIQDFQFWLRRTSNPERDSFLFLFHYFVPLNNGSYCFRYQEAFAIIEKAIHLNQNVMLHFLDVLFLNRIWLN